MTDPNPITPTTPIEVPTDIAELGQDIATVANSLANETARPTVVNLEGMVATVAALQGSLVRMAEWINEVRRKPPLALTAQFLLWGFHADHRDGEVVILAGGHFRKCETEFNSRHNEGGWTMQILPAGEDPTGLRSVWALTKAAHERTTVQGKGN